MPSASEVAEAGEHGHKQLPMQPRLQGHRPVTFDSSQINTSSVITRNVPSSGMPDHHADSERLGGIAQCRRRQQSAQQRQREDPVEKSRMVIGKASPDRLRHQRINARIPRADEKRPGRGAETVIRRIQNQQPNSAAMTLDSSSRVCFTRGRIATAPSLPVRETASTVPASTARLSG